VALLAVTAGLAPLWPVAANARTPEPPPPPERCSILDFDTATVTTKGDDHVLTVSGTKPWLDMVVTLEPVVYIRQPEFWRIEVQGCHPGEVGLPATGPYTATFSFTGTMGTRGIEVAGANKTQQFDLVSPPPATKNALANTSWVLDPASLGVPVPKGRSITAKFSDTTVGGSASCNLYNAPYTVGPGFRLTFGPIITTKIACTADTAASESAYLKKLAAVTRYRVIGGQLWLFGSQGTLRFRSAPPEAPPSAALVGQWQVTGVFGGTPGAIVPIARGTTITLNIKSDNTLDGQACNSYSAPYKADEKSFGVGLITSTLMLCTGVVGDQEARYFNALQAAGTWRVEGGTLTLTDGQGRDVITATSAAKP